MTATATTTPNAATVQVKPFSFSLEQYQLMIESGVLTEEHKVELIHGQLFEKIPITTEHAATVSKLRHYFSKKFADKYEITSENPIALPNDSQPEPDCVIALFREDFYLNQHPTPPEIFVVIEVAKSTLYTDRYLKAAAYAGAGIKEYWIINLVDTQVEIHLKPNLETSTFAEVEQFKPGESF
ncbi:MAG: Uma2 family endonuclease, partial [Bacteroidota bacterium]